jgi:hypothetical protein
LAQFRKGPETISFQTPEAAAMTKTVTVHSQQKWECFYEGRKTQNSLLIESNRLGQEGWELVTVLYYKDIKGEMCWGAFFKRPSTGDAHPASDGQAALARSVVVPTASPANASPVKASPAEAGFDLTDTDFKLAAE